MAAADLKNQTVALFETFTMTDLDHKAAVAMLCDPAWRRWFDPDSSAFKEHHGNETAGVLTLPLRRSGKLWHFLALRGLYSLEYADVDRYPITALTVALFACDTGIEAEVCLARLILWERVMLGLSPQPTCNYLGQQAVASVFSLFFTGMAPNRTNTLVGPLTAACNIYWLAVVVPSQMERCEIDMLNRFVESSNVVAETKGFAYFVRLHTGPECECHLEHGTRTCVRLEEASFKTAFELLSCGK